MKRLLIALSTFVGLALLAPTPTQTFVSARQIINVRSSTTPGTGATSYMGWTGTPTGPGGGEFSVKSVWPSAGTFRNLIMNLSVAPGAGKSWAFTLRKNGVNSSVTCTIADTATTCRDTTNSMSVSVLDELSMQVVPTGGPTTPGNAGVFVSTEFEPTTANESGYAQHPTSSSDGTNRFPIFNGLNTVWTTNAGTTVENPASAPGTITALCAKTTNDATDVGESVSVHIYKNGVKQDGSGGTQNTEVALPDGTQKACSATVALTVTAGDTFYAERTDVGTVNATGLSVGVRFVSTTAGESQYCGIGSGNISTGSVSYQKLHSDGANGGWDTTEANKTIFAGVTTFSLSKLYVKLQAAPGASKSYAIATRKNSASPGGMPTCTVSGAVDTTCADTSANAVTYVDTDTFTIQSTPSGTPTATAASWCYTQTDTALAAPPGGFNALLVNPGLQALLRGVPPLLGRAGLHTGRAKRAEKPVRLW